MGGLLVDVHERNLGPLPGLGGLALPFPPEVERLSRLSGEARDTPASPPLFCGDQLRGNAARFLTNELAGGGNWSALRTAAGLRCLRESSARVPKRAAAI